MLFLVFFLSFICAIETLRLLPISYRPTFWSSRCKRPDFDSREAKEIDNVLKDIEPLIDNFKQDKSLNTALQKDQELKEEIHRAYPYEQKGLPVLPDCNNYYSGTSGDYFWHQNADQVFVYIPVDDSIEKKDVHVKFEAKKVSLAIRGTEEISFPCAERIIPDGSFWLFEIDKEGKRFVQLDLEKRFRMINWKGLFCHSQPDTPPEVSQKRTEMLEKLFAANKGISKLNGVPSETMQEMMSNGDLTRMIADEVFTTPQVSTISNDGTESESFSLSDEVQEEWEEGEEKFSENQHHLDINDLPILEGEVVDDN